MMESAIRTDQGEGGDKDGGCDSYVGEEGEGVDDGDGSFDGDI